MGKLGSSICAIVACALVLAAWASMAFGSSGEISRAEVASDWSSVDIAGTVSWTGCEHTVPYGPKPLLPPGSPEPPGYKEPLPPPPCAWIPFATIGPVAEDCSSSGRKWPDALGPGTSLAWHGGQRDGMPDVATFDLPHVPLSGPGQLLCLSLVEIGAQPLVCIQLAGFYCPPYGEARYSVPLSSRVLSRPEPVDSGRGGGASPPAQAPALGSPPEPAAHKPGAVTRCARRGSVQRPRQKSGKCRRHRRGDKSVSKN